VTRSTSILIRVSPEERETLKAAASRAGLGLGPWLRSLGMREARKSEPKKERGTR
jgi:uncharacterized protein (DUF1778 family)